MRSKLQLPLEIMKNHQVKVRSIKITSFQIKTGQQLQEFNLIIQSSEYLLQENPKSIKRTHFSKGLSSLKSNFSQRNHSLNLISEVFSMLIIKKHFKISMLMINRKWKYSLQAVLSRRKSPQLTLRKFFLFPFRISHM